MVYGIFALPNGCNAYTGVAQTVPTTIGATYRLTFWVTTFVATSSTTTLSFITADPYGDKMCGLDAITLVETAN